MDGKENRPEKVEVRYLLPPADYPPYEEDRVSLADYIRVLWKRRWLIVLGTLGCTVTAFLVSHTLPKVYQATSTLILLPPRFSTEFRPEPMSVATYQTLLESDYIRAKVVEALRSKGLTREDDNDLGADLKAEILPGKERDQPYEPLIQLVVEAEDPEKAAGIANTWAEVFVVENQELNVLGKQGTLEFIEKQYPVTARSLVELERSLKNRETSYDQALLQLQNQWNERLLDFTTETERLKTQLLTATEEMKTAFINETERLRKEHEKETEQLRLEFLNRWKPDLLKEELKVKEEKLTQLENNILDIDLAIKTSRDTLEQIKKEIKSQPQYLVLSKAITDEALWERIGRDGSGSLPEQLEQLKLRSELLNPVYQSLLERLTATQIEYDTTVPRREHLKSQLERVRKEIDQLKEVITDKDIELFALLKNRELELNTLLKNRELELNTLIKNRDLLYQNLVEDRKSRLAVLERTRDYEIAELKRQREFEMTQLTRERDSTKSTYTTLAAKYEAAQLARAEENQDVRIGAFAVPPASPVKPQPLLNTAVAFAVGLMMSLMLAFVVEFIESVDLTGTGEKQLVQVPASSLESGRSVELRKRASS